jgi:hypothetical protein
MWLNARDLLAEYDADNNGVLNINDTLEENHLIFLLE